MNRPAPDTRAWGTAAEVGPVRHQLDHEHDDQPRFRIDAVVGAVGAAPSEGAHRTQPARAVAIDRLEAKAESEPGRRVQRADLVRRHQRDGSRREDADAIERAAVANHLEEARVVARGREQARAAGEVLARARRRSGPARGRPPARERSCRPVRSSRPSPGAARCSGGRKNCVSFIPSGVVIRAAMN